MERLLKLKQREHFMHSFTLYINSYICKKVNKHTAMRQESETSFSTELSFLNYSNRLVM